MPSVRFRSGVLAVSILVGLYTLYAANSMVHSEPRLENKPDPSSQSSQAQAQAQASSSAASYSSSQDLVESSRMHPAVLLWGSNSNNLICPAQDPTGATSTTSESTDGTAVALLQGLTLRDLAFAESHAAAISHSGDLLQWGPAFAIHLPATTLKMRDLVAVRCSATKTYALTRMGDLLEITPDPTAAAKNAAVQVSTIRLPASASPSERITDIACGNNHLIALSSAGLVYTLATDINGNKFGQLGLGSASDEALTSMLTPVQRLAGIKCDKIAAGRTHSIVGSADGRVFGFGHNRVGQLGIGTTKDAAVPDPTEIRSLWSSTGSKSPKPLDAKCSQIAAGGDTSLFVIDTMAATQVMSSGNGQFGQLGNGSFSHAQFTPVLIKQLSNLVEYDEKHHKVVPIRIAKIAVGNAHCAAVLDNSPGAPASSTLSSMLGRATPGSTTLAASSASAVANTVPLSSSPSPSSTSSSLSSASLASRFASSWKTSPTVFGRDLMMWGRNLDGELMRADSKRGNAPVPGSVLAISAAPASSSTLPSSVIHAIPATPVAASTTVTATTAHTPNNNNKIESNDQEQNVLKENLRMQLASVAPVYSRDGCHHAYQDIALGHNLTAVFTRSVVA
eukprot:jgi/Hompol1/1980/HPOL_005809-RA